MQNPETHKNQKEIKKFEDLSKAVRIFAAKYASPAARKSAHISRLAYEEPKEAIDHLRVGANLPENLTYERQLDLAKSFLESMFGEEFNVESLLAEGMPESVDKILSAEEHQLIAKYNDLKKRFEKLFVGRPLRDLPPELSSKAMRISYSTEKSVENIYDGYNIGPEDQIDILESYFRELQDYFSK